MDSKPGFISFQVRSNKKEGTEYATYNIAKRVNGKKINVTEWLGRVIDKNKGFFYTNKKGYYKFTPEYGYENIDQDLVTQYTMISKDGKDKPKSSNKNPSIINIGGIYIFDEFIKSTKLDQIIGTAYLDDLDTLFSLILFRLLNKNCNKYAYNWWNETYAKFIYPNATLDSQRISDFLVKISEDANITNFFKNYLTYIKQIAPKSNILIDSTGLQNSIKIPITAINNHNGIINNEIRLIVVFDKSSGYPLYYKHVPGNTVDVTTLISVINELKEYNIDINQSILDAGYYSEGNLIELCDNNIPFLTRMIQNRTLYKSLLTKYIPDIEKSENMVTYKNRTLFIQKVPIKITENQYDALAYVCLDNDRYSQDRTGYFKFVKKNELTNDKLQNDMISFGSFILLSSFDLQIDELLPCYYSRQGIEQMFDYLKNEIDILPIRNHTEQTVAGHIFVSFLASLVYFCIDNTLKKNNFPLSSTIDSLNRHCGHIYKDKIIIDSPSKIVNDVSKALKVKIPNKIIL